MKVLLVEKERYLKTYWGEYFRAMDVEFVDSDPDVIFGFSVTVMGEYIRACGKWPKAKKVQYGWDIYDWTWTRPRPGEYNYDLYGKTLEDADLVLMPSEMAGNQIKARFNVKQLVVYSGVPVFDAPVRDNGFVL